MENSIKEKLRLIREGAFENFSLTFEETNNALTYIQEAFIMENQTNDVSVESVIKSTTMKEKIKKFFKWILDKIMRFIERIKDIFKSKKSLYTKIILKNKDRIMSYSGDEPIVAWEYLLKPRLDLDEFKVHIGEMFKKCKKMMFIDSKYDKLTEKDMVEYLIEEVFGVKGIDYDVLDLQPILERVYGKKVKIGLNEINKSELLNMMIYFDKLETKFSDMYIRLRRELSDMEDRIIETTTISEEKVSFDKSDVDALMSATIRLIKATVFTIDVVTSIAFEGYESIKDICEYIIKLSNRDSIDDEFEEQIQN